MIVMGDGWVSNRNELHPAFGTAARSTLTYVWVHRARVLFIRTSGVRRWITHHPQHRRTTGAQETDDEDRGKDQEDDVEHRRVIEGDARLDDLRVTRGRDETEGIEEEFDH